LRIAEEFEEGGGEEGVGEFEGAAAGCGAAGPPAPNARRSAVALATTVKESQYPQPELGVLSVKSRQRQQQFS